MSNRTIRTNDLQVGDAVAVRGKLQFARLTRQISGAELDRENERRAKYNIAPTTNPYSTITITDAQVVYKNPNNKSLIERYAEESLYQSNNPQTPGIRFTANKSGHVLPYVAQMGQDGKAHEIKPEGELDSGLDVSVIIRVFKGRMNNGVGLEGVIVNEPIRYYTSNNVGAALHEALGIDFVPYEGLSREVPKETPAQAPTNYPTQPYNNPAPVQYNQPAPQVSQYTANPNIAPNYEQPVVNPYNAPSNQGIRYNPATDGRNY